MFQSEYRPFPFFPDPPTALTDPSIVMNLITTVESPPTSLTLSSQYCIQIFLYMKQRMQNDHLNVKHFEMNV